MSDAFYETTAPKDPKQKRKDWWAFTTSSDDPFAIAGLVKEGRFTMLTCDPGPDVAPIHDRQVVVLTPSEWRNWLSASEPPVLAPSPAGLLKVEAVTG